MSLQKKLLISFVALVIGVSVAACGNNSNNDQGTSFLALGYFTLVNDEVAPTTQVRFSLESDIPLGTGTGSESNVLIGLENRLATQFIRIERYDCSYDIPGAQPGFTVPDFVERASFVIGAAGVGGDGLEGDARFPGEDEAVRPQVLFSNIAILSTDTVAFLNVNRNSIPALPFTMTATCRAVGITQAGDVLTTNPVSIPVLLVRDSFLNPPAGGGIPMLDDDNQVIAADDAGAFTAQDESQEDIELAPGLTVE